MKKIDVLVNPKKRFHCEDYGDRKGCGLEYKLIKQANGKTNSYSAVQIPCVDKEGNTVWVYVPHWFDCPEQEEYKLQFMRDKAKKNAEWAEKNAKPSESGGEDEYRSTRRGARRVSAEY